MDKKNLVSVLVIIVLVAAGFFFYKKSKAPQEEVQNVGEVEDVSQTGDSNTNSDSGTELKNTSFDQSWKVFDLYVAAAKAHDLDTLKKYSYQLSDECSNKSREKECFALMDSFVIFSNEIKKEDYKYIWEDKSQIILSTDFRKDSFGESIGYLKGYIYFIRDNYTGSIKLLKIDPNRGWFYTPRDVDTPDFPEKKLQAMILDTDMDGLTDEQELCSGSYLDAPDCTHTNPNERDTDRDGWWDGVEFYFKK